ncbi:MAG: adenylate/guanylate cyclase domain-containing protein [Dongiaceae bacterium]
MVDVQVQRRLAAILAADVVGYSRLIDLDEAGTLAALKERRRDMLDPLVARHRGRIVKVMGDGVLIDFASAVNAVACAVELQQRMQAANDGKADEKQIRLRIGVNLGDVVVEAGDLYGDGVIIAVRLQALAEPGGVCVSRGVHEQVRNKLPFTYEDLGPCKVKNVAKPVRALRVRWDGQDVVPSPAPAAAVPARQSRAKLALAVLPFTNLSGDPGQQYLSDGITEDIITELARFHQLQVVARNSSFRYRGQDEDVIHVGRELGVHYLVEGSVRRSGERMRITAQLIDAETGHHLWADRFDRNQSELFAMQDEVVRTIVGTLVGRVQAAGAESAKRKPPTSLEAYECVLRGDALPFDDPASEAEARHLYERAIELDPGYARAYAFLSQSECLSWIADMGPSDAGLDRALDLAKKAVQLDGNDYQCQANLGWTYLYRQTYDLAEHHYKSALELNRNGAMLRAGLASYYAYIGKTDLALEHFDEARRTDPFFNPTWYWPMVGITHFVARQYDEAILQLSRAPNMPFWVHAYLVACYALADQADRAAEHAAILMRMRPDFSLGRFAAKEPLKNAADRQRLIDGLRQANLPA